MYLDIFLRFYIWAAERGVNAERATNFEKHTEIQTDQFKQNQMPLLQN